MKKTMKILIISLLAVVMVSAFSVAAFAEAGNVAGAIEGTWNAAETQIKQVVNNVVFPIIDLVLAVFFFAKLGLAYFDYRKTGHFEWTAPAILFCLPRVHDDRSAVYLADYWGRGCYGECVINKRRLGCPLE